MAFNYSLLYTPGIYNAFGNGLRSEGANTLTNVMSFCLCF